MSQEMVQEKVNWSAVAQKWDALTSGATINHKLAKKLAKVLFWVSLNVAVNGNDLFEMWKQINVSDRITHREVVELIEDVDVAVSVFLWSLQDANLVDLVSPTLIARDEGSDVVELAWGVVYGSRKRYLVLRITQRGIVTKTRVKFSGNILHGFAVAAFG